MQCKRTTEEPQEDHALQNRSQDFLIIGRKFFDEQINKFSLSYFDHQCHPSVEH